jgi:serine/threonine-protein kinase HipA
MMTLARLVGIDVPAVNLVDVDAIGNLPGGIDNLKGQALAVERFDRLPDGTPVHIEDFAQIFGVYPRDKYKKASYMNIASVIAAESNDADVSEFIRRLTFNTLIGNADTHMKNWSMFYPDTRKAVLSPAYDFVATVAYIKDDNTALTFSRTKRFDEFSEDELRHLAARAMLPEGLVVETARQTAQVFHEHWQAEKKNLPLASAVIEAVEVHLKRIPLRKAVAAA